MVPDFGQYLHSDRANNLQTSFVDQIDQFLYVGGFLPFFLS